MFVSYEMLKVMEEFPQVNAVKRYFLQISGEIAKKG